MDEGNVQRVDAPVTVSCVLFFHYVAMILFCASTCLYDG